MPYTIIGQNMRRVRLAKGLTQEDVADKASVSIAGYRNFEAGRAMPKVNTLLDISHVLDTSLEELVSEPRTLTDVRFRAKKRLNSRDQILSEVAKWLDDFAELEQATGNKIPWSLGTVKKGATPQGTARNARALLGILPHEPVRDICGLLEHSGVKVLPRPVCSTDFFGLAVDVSDGGPAIVVNTWDRISVERWIFSAAHELGHLLMHRYSFRVEEQEEIDAEEDEANRFAAYFLMPEELFAVEWEKTYGLPFVNRVLKVKRILRVSYLTVLYRLAEKGDKDVWPRFMAQYTRASGKHLTRTDEPQPIGAKEFRTIKPVEDKRAQEPKGLVDVDFTEDRLSNLVRLAVEQQAITRARAAEILHLSPEEMACRMEEWVA